MALSGLQIYKLLPQTNCKECGFPTCLAFAMKLAQKGTELDKCPYVSDEARTALDAASAPPIKLVTIGAGDRAFEVGNETVMFRHEKTFVHQPGLVVRVKSDAADLAEVAARVGAYSVERVGMTLTLDGLAVEDAGGGADAYAAAVAAARAAAPGLPLVLMSADAAAIDAALAGGAAAEKPLVHAATAANWQAMAEVAKKHGCPLVIRSRGRRPRRPRRALRAGPRRRRGGPRARPRRHDPRRRPRRRHAAAPPGAQEGRAGARLPARRRRGGADVAGRAGARHPGRRQVRRRHHPRPLRAGDALLAAHAAPEHLHRPAEADPDGAQALRDRRRDRRQPGAHHDQLLAHLLLGGGRGRGRRHPHVAARRRQRRPVRAHRLGGRQVRRREDRQDGQGLRHRADRSATRSWSSRATWPGSRARSRKSCPTGRSWSARATPSTSPTTSRTSGAHERHFRHEAADGDGDHHVHAVRGDDRGAQGHEPARRGDPLRAGRPCPVRGAGTLRPLPRARHERRGRAAQQRRPGHRRDPRRLGGGLPDLRRRGRHRDRRARARARRRCGRTGTPSPSRSRCPSPATTCRTRRCGLFAARHRAAVAGRPDQRLRPAAPGAARSSTASRSSAPSCPCCGGSARTCAWPTGRSA